MAYNIQLLRYISNIRSGAQIGFCCQWNFYEGELSFKSGKSKEFSFFWTQLIDQQIYKSFSRSYSMTFNPKGITELYF